MLNNYDFVEHRSIMPPECGRMSSRRH